MKNIKGTVTIDLQDFENLLSKSDENEERKDYYFKIASAQIDLLEKIEEFFQGEKIAEGLSDEINYLLAKWYG